MPGGRRHDGLGPFAGGDVGTELDRVRRAILIGDLQIERAAGVIVPDLDGIDAMPVRAVAPRQQVVDRSRTRPSCGIGTGVAKRLAIIPAFGMRPQFEARNDIVGAGHWCLMIGSCDLFL